MDIALLFDRIAQVARKRRRDAAIIRRRGGQRMRDRTAGALLAGDARVGKGIERGRAFAPVGRRPGVGAIGDAGLVDLGQEGLARGNQLWLQPTQRVE